jgi:hypothetical protein
VPRIKANSPQWHQLHLIRKASFNSFDGNMVVDCLLANQDLWHGVMMDGDGSYICLRDIKTGWNVDTMYITCREHTLEAMLALVRTWGADSIITLSENEASQMLGGFPAPYKVIKIWWD